MEELSSYFDANFDDAVMPIPTINASSKAVEQIDTILDKDWAKKSFLVSGKDLPDYYDEVNLYWNAANRKFTDTRMGGSIGVNARPQFTRYSDIRRSGRYGIREQVTIGADKGNFGMGGYYSEAIDDPGQVIYMRFGVPQFTSLFRFFSLAFDPGIATMVSTGRPKSLFYDIGEAAGTFVFAMSAPLLTTGIVIMRAVNSFFTRPVSKYYTIKPTMFMYWVAVSSLLNNIAVNIGMLPRNLMKFDADQKKGEPVEVDQEYLSMVSDLLPDVFNKNNGIDGMALATRAQRISNQLFLKSYERINNGSATDFEGYVKDNADDKINHPPGEHSIMNLIKAVSKVSYWVSDDEVEQAEGSPRESRQNSSEGSSTSSGVTPPPNGLADYLDAEFTQGADFATFRVDHTGSVTESFSNSAVESELSMKFNGAAAAAREMKFSFAGGNIGEGVIADAVEGAIIGMKDLVVGGISGLTMGLSNAAWAFLGGHFMDIPKHWDSSTVSLPKSTYTMTLISPYNNPISRLQNIYLPMCMLMTAALPRSTGKQSYTSPFLCQLFDRGRSQTRLGIIDSLSFTRGVSNLPFDKKGNALAIDVSFSVLDLSSIMHMPVSSGALLNYDIAMDEDNILMDYLAVISGQDIKSQIYQPAKGYLAMAKKLRSLDNLTSPAYLSALFHDKVTSDGLLSQMNPLTWPFRALDSIGSGSQLLDR